MVENAASVKNILTFFAVFHDITRTHSTTVFGARSSHGLQDNASVLICHSLLLGHPLLYP